MRSALHAYRPTVIYVVNFYKISNIAPFPFFLYTRSFTFYILIATIHYTYKIVAILQLEYCVYTLFI